MRKTLLLLLTLTAACAGTRGNGIDLVELFDGAQKQSNLGLHQAFAIGEYTVGGDKRRGIFSHPTSTITFRLTVPARARFEAAIGMSEEAYSAAGDGARFHVGVRDGGKYVPLFERHLNPAVWAADRGWQAIDLPLDGYAGRQVELVLNTHASADGEADPRNDFAIWGAPTIVQARQP